MTVLDTLNFVAFNPLQNNNSTAVLRRKLMATMLLRSNRNLRRPRVVCSAS